MISDKKFLEGLVAGIKELVGEKYTVETEEIVKNNGMKLTGVILSPKDEAVTCMCPILYADSYYQMYREGMDMQKICYDMYETFQSCDVPDELKDTSFLSDWNWVRTRVVYRLVNAEYNKELLEQVPHKRFLDLERVFVVELARNEKGSMNYLIRSGHLEQMGVSVDEITLQANINTEELLPISVRPMSTVLEELAKKAIAGAGDSVINNVEQEAEAEMYVLSNQDGTYGAGAILYPGALQQLAKKMDADLVIIPSSVHEVLVWPCRNDRDVNFDELRSMVRMVNTYEVSVEDRLSEQVYIYRRSTNKIEIAK